MCKLKNKFGRKAMSFILSAVMLAAYYVPGVDVIEVKAENENPSGYLQGITDNLGEIQESWYIQPNTTFYNAIISNYDGSYNSESTALEIRTKEEFAAFGKAVNDGGKTFEGKYVKLMNDIDLQGSGITFTNSSSGNFTVTVTKYGTPQNIWNPAGNDTTQFKGVFNGQNHKIYNMTSLQKVASGSKYSGIFGRTDGGIIKNVRIEGTSSGYCSSDNSSAGGIVGWMTSGKIINCHSNCNVYSYGGSNKVWVGGLVGNCNAESVLDSHATGNVYAYGQVTGAGGLFGENRSNLEVISCYSTGNIYATGNGAHLIDEYGSHFVQVGGFAGNVLSFPDVTLETTIQNCYSTGDVYAYATSNSTEIRSIVGGFVGYYGYTTTTSMIKNCYSTGDVHCWEDAIDRGSNMSNIGGFCGTCSRQASIINCFTSGSVYDHSTTRTLQKFSNFVGNKLENCYYSSSSLIREDSTDVSETFNGIETSLSNLKGTVTNTISRFNDDKVWYFADGEYPKLMWELSANVSLGNCQLQNDGSTYYTFPSATVTSDTSDLKIYSIIVSAMDKENPEELKSGARIVSTGNGMTADSNNTDNSQYYTSTSGLTLAQAQSFVRGLKFYSIEDFNAKVQLSYSQLPSDVHYYPGTGHYYKVVNDQMTWIDAYKAALGSNFRGEQGYLANITSEGENNFLCELFQGKQFYIGGTKIQIDGINTLSAGVTDTSLGYFYWASGPELLYNPNTKTYGTPNPQNSVFYNKLKDYTTTIGTIIYEYANWAGAEPSAGASVAEDVVRANAANYEKKWGDTGHSTEYLSAIEYGDRLYGNSETISCMASATKEVTMNLNVNLGNSQLNNDGSAYYTFPSAAVTSDTSDLKIYSIIVSAMDEENPEELKSGARIVSTGSGMIADSNNTDNSQYYTSASGLTLAQAQSFVRGLKFYSDENLRAKVQLGYSPLPNDVHYYPGTGHYYKVVNSTMTWIDAYKAALNSNFKGMQGYLANITSEGENNFAWSNRDTNAWLGGTRKQITNINTTSASLTDTNLGYWYWASGPELLYNPNTKSYNNPNSTNSIFYDKVTLNDATATSTIVCNYSNWNSYEPNNSKNYGSDESCLTLDSQGKWNDTNNDFSLYSETIHFPSAYLIEYGDRLYGNSESLNCTATALSKICISYSQEGSLAATYGQTLAQVPFTNITISTEGTWSWANSSESVDNTGTKNFSATFIPTDTDNYNTLENVSISVTVGRATPTYNQQESFSAVYGQTLSQVPFTNITASTEGTWSWADSSESVGNVGTKNFSATFSPTDTNNYNSITQDLSVTVTGFSVSDIILPIASDGSYGQDAVMSASITSGGNSFKLPAGYSIRWDRSQDGSSFAAVDGKTGLTYIVSSDDFDCWFKAVVVCPDGNEVASTAKALPNPMGDMAVSIREDLIEDTKILTAVIALNSELNYQWQRGKHGIFTAIANATSQTYTPCERDYNMYLKVLVTVTGGGSVSSEPVFFRSPNKVTVPGENEGTILLTASNTTAEASQETLSLPSDYSTGYTIQWQRCKLGSTEFEEINNAADLNYSASAEDYDHYIRAVVKDQNNQIVSSKPVLIKFFKNTISFGSN